MASILVIFLSICISLRYVTGQSPPSGSYVPSRVVGADNVLLEFPLNLEYLEAEFFLYGGLGYGLDEAAPELTSSGPSPIGAKMANLDNTTRNIIVEFAYQEVGHIRAIKSTVGGFPRPQLDLSSETFAKIMDAAFNTSLNPPFDPYASSINYLLASYLIPYVGLTGYVGTNAKVHSSNGRRLLAGLLGVESGQDAVIRALLYDRMGHKVKPYDITVAEFTAKLSRLRNELGRGPMVDEGLSVPDHIGAEGLTSSNILSADANSVAYARTPEEILRVVYSSGNASVPGGFYPRGGSGFIASSYLTERVDSF